MACATLKRSLDFDPVHSHGRPSKRQRCVPMCVSPSSSPPTTSTSDYSPSPFSDACPKMTPEAMAAGIREEIRRLHRRKQLHFNPQGGASGHHAAVDADSSSSESSSPGPASPTSAFVHHQHQPSVSRDKPLFTFRQVGIICERMLSERETQLREEYDRILNMKLSEQYDAFVKFSNDQLHRRFDVSTAPSYLS
ncbi:akirin-like [Nilaparvata lugens]|uniref:Akirin n=1 Tax=Nilaparvata lugens TaxID=108931 RepID=A0A2U9Q5H9_NILLU|nr:akirin-like [Nilaparvata lugens]AWT86615.1 akirin [Nilaparvata lugens]